MPPMVKKRFWVEWSTEGRFWCARFHENTVAKVRAERPDRTFTEHEAEVPVIR